MFETRKVHLCGYASPQLAFDVDTGVVPIGDRPGLSDGGDLLNDAISAPPKHAHRASALHYVARLPSVRWPICIPACGLHIRTWKTALILPLDAIPPHIDLALGMERILPVYAAPWAEPLPVNTFISSKEDAVAVLEQYLADPGFFHSTWFTDGSPLNGSAGGAAVRIEDGAVHERILIPLGDGQIAEGEVEGVLRATERAVKSEECHEVLAVSDSRTGLQGITSTAPRSGQFRAIEYDVPVRSAMSRHPALKITNLWTPAHIGTTGNELADEAVKAAK
ncbi:hypothetical protein C8R44DRAFT_889448 [Mycena epipterygia]|nr:hypothetical protein C8R44DRAFT_889448 [Mycena epipterygia]